MDDMTTWVSGVRPFPQQIPVFRPLSNETVEQDSNGSGISLAAILAALVPSLTSAAFLLIVFIIIRRPLRKIYAPRTFMDVIPEKDRTPISSLKRFEWIRTLCQLDDKFVLEHSSLDGYLYLRFLRTTIFLCFLGACITWPILFPINATGGGSASQLDKLGFGNVHDKNRLYAHAVVAWVFYGAVMFVVARERMWLVGLRQAWYLSRANASRLSSRTVLYLDPPSSDTTTTTTTNTAQRKWAVRNTKTLDDAVETRDDRLARLEYAEVAYLRHASRKIARAAGNVEDANVEAARPQERSYYLAGTAVDVLDHLRDEVKEAMHKVDEKREAYASAESNDNHQHHPHAVFVEYPDQYAAQKAYRGESKSRIPVPRDLELHHSRLIGVVPSEVHWRNLAMPQAERLSKKSVANILVVLLIIFWSIPTAIVGSISNINYLSTFQWLHWLQDLPDPILGLLEGFLPPLLTSLLASYVPIFLRFIAKVSGEPTIVTTELTVQAWYFAFQIIQVFLVTALSSSATAFIPKIINEPHHVPQLLADNIPKSSNFYLTYFVVQGLGSSVKTVMNWSDLLSYLFWEFFIYKTPRDKFQQYTSLKGIAWGKVYPKFTNFLIIALVYSCISPLVLGFATIGLALFYCGYKYNLLFVVQPKVESKGKCYTRALQQVLTGVYIGQLCLIGLFGLRKAKGPLVMVLVLFLATVAYNVLTNRYLKPLEDHFSDEILEHHDELDEQEPLLTAEEGQAQHDAEAALRQRVLDPLQRIFEPRVYASRSAMRAFLGKTEGPAQQYSEEEIAKAYVAPSLKSKAMVLWLPRDGNGLSAGEIEALAERGIEATDEGAWVDEKGKVGFEREKLRELVVWKETVNY